MKSFAAALFVAVVSAHDHVDDIEEVVTAPAASGANTIGVISINIGLVYDGSGPDATVSPVMALTTVSNPALSSNLFKNAASEYRMAFATSETAESSELSSITIASNGVMTYTYGDWAVTPEAGLTADLSSGNAGSYAFGITSEQGYIAQPGAVSPGAAYWSLDQGLFENVGDHATEGEVLQMGFIRSNPGVAGIAAGATAYGKVKYNFNGGEFFNQGGAITWPAAEVDSDSDDETDDETTDPATGGETGTETGGETGTETGTETGGETGGETTDPTTGGETGGDGDSNDDGAMTFATSGAALLAAAYALTF